MVAVATVVAQQAERLPGIEHQQVWIAVHVVIADGAAAADSLQVEAGARCR